MRHGSLLISLSLLAPIATMADSAFAAEESRMSQTITRAGSQPAAQGPAEYFTGQHPVVTAGLGWTQVWGGPIVELHPGDVVWCPPGVKHWRGATPTSSMTHMALTGTLKGKNVEWMEKVTDEQYRE